jgi:hypothetical protein
VLKYEDDIARVDDDTLTDLLVRARSQAAALQSD